MVKHTFGRFIDQIIVLNVVNAYLSDFNYKSIGLDGTKWYLYISLIGIVLKHYSTEEYKYFKPVYTKLHVVIVYTKLHVVIDINLNVQIKYYVMHLWVISGVAIV